MIIENIECYNFRNFKDVNIKLGNKYNIIFGNNGHGKTNLIESIYILSNLKSFRNSRNCELTRLGSEISKIHAHFNDDYSSNFLSVEIDQYVKKPYINENCVANVGEYLELTSSVLFYPDDILMVKGEPELRRKYIDRAIFSLDPSYLKHFHLYQKALKNRNALLKEQSFISLNAWNEEVVKRGITVVTKRYDYIRQLNSFFSEYYPLISGNRDSVEIAYNSTTGASDLSLEERALYFALKLDEKSEEEFRKKSTVTGPHRDDIIIKINGMDSRKFSSQGEARSIILSLKLAEISVIEKFKKVSPIFMIDDFTSELDSERRERFIDFLDQKSLQVIITSINPDVISERNSREISRYRVVNGRIYC